MKRLVIVLTILAGSLVRADDLSTARTLMASVLAELATHDKLSLVVTGAVTDNTDIRPFKTTLVFEKTLVGAERFIKMELVEYVGNAVVSRTVADGTRLWSYNVAGNTYKSSNYATETFAGQELDRLFRLLALRTRDHQTFLARVLNDAYGSKSSQIISTWAPWRPNSTIGFAQKSIVCASTEPFSNQLTYIINDVEGVGPVLLGADYHEESVISGRTRIVHWQLVLESYEIPQGTSFEFVAPTGSKAVAASEPGGG